MRHGIIIFFATSIAVAEPAPSSLPVQQYDDPQLYNADSCLLLLTLPLRCDSIFACLHLYGHIWNLCVIILCSKGKEEVSYSLLDYLFCVGWRICNLLQSHNFHRRNL